MFRPISFSLITIGAVTALGACATDAATGATSAGSSDLVIRASGNGDWTVRCEADTRRGSTVRPEIDGRGSTDYDVIFVTETVSASCTYSAGDEPLTLTLPEADETCPFESTSEAFCRTIVPAGGSGAFEFTSG